MRRELALFTLLPRSGLLGNAALYIRVRRYLFLVSNISDLLSGIKGSPDPQADDAEGYAEAGVGAGTEAES